MFIERDMQTIKILAPSVLREEMIEGILMASRTFRPVITWSYEKDPESPPYGAMPFLMNTRSPQHEDIQIEFLCPAQEVEEVLLSVRMFHPAEEIMIKVQPAGFVNESMIKGMRDFALREP